MATCWWKIGEGVTGCAPRCVNTAGFCWGITACCTNWGAPTPGMWVGPNPGTTVAPTPGMMGAATGATGATGPTS